MSLCWGLQWSQGWFPGWPRVNWSVHIWFASTPQKPSVPSFVTFALFIGAPSVSIPITHHLLTPSLWTSTLSPFPLSCTTLIPANVAHLTPVTLAPLTRHPIVVRGSILSKQCWPQTTWKPPNDRPLTIWSGPQITCSHGCSNLGVNQLPSKPHLRWAKFISLPDQNQSQPFNIGARVLRGYTADSSNFIVSYIRAY